MADKLLEVSVVAKRLNCSTMTIYRHMKKENSPLEFVVVGIGRSGYRVKESSVLALVSESSTRDI